MTLALTFIPKSSVFSILSCEWCLTSSGINRSAPRCPNDIILKLM